MSSLRLAGIIRESITDGRGYDLPYLHKVVPMAVFSAIIPRPGILTEVLMLRWIR